MAISLTFVATKTYNDSVLFYVFTKGKIDAYERRPTDAIKDTTVKVRLDDHTRKMLAYCVEAMNLSKSELIRLCIAKEYKELLRILSNEVYWV